MQLRHAGTPSSCAFSNRSCSWRADTAPTIAELRATFERWSNDLTDVVARMNDDAWSSTAEFYFGGKKVSEQPVGQFLWSILFDAIHHRGQLTAYLRPMGAAVPAIYGPSADSRPS